MLTHDILKACSERVLIVVRETSMLGKKPVVSNAEALTGVLFRYQRIHENRKFAELGN